MAGAVLRAAVVGCRVGRAHADAYVHSDLTELVALCDVVRATLDEVGDAFDVDARYTDYETMLADVRPDIVSVATPQALHAQMTILAATTYTPKAILCEKGMASNLGEARAMLAACDAKQVKLIIGHEGRQFSTVAKARRLIAEGAIGQPLLHRVWYDQGGMMNQMCHGCDRAMYLMGDPEPAWVIANVQRESDRWERGWPAEELAAGTIGFPNGMRLMLEGETPPGIDEEPHRHTIVGTDGLLVVRTEGEVRARDAKAEGTCLQLLRGTGGGWESTPFTGETYRDCRRREIHDLARWASGEIDGHRQDAHLCIRTQEILMAMYESARTHTKVDLPLKTIASPLVAMIDAGALPVRYPGRYDIRHQTALPPAP